MAYKIWQYVDRVDGTPNVLVDMNKTGQIILEGDSLELPSPVLTRQFSTSPMRDGAELSSASYENRDLIFNLHVDGPSNSVKARRLNSIIERLSNPGLIKYQLDSTMDPMFFRTMRSDEYKVKQRKAGIWTIECMVTAKPFALGIRRQLPTVTITNDPNGGWGGTNWIHWDINGADVIGDSEADTLIKISNFNTAALGWRHKNNPQALTTWAQAESGTLGTDTTSAALTDASGGNGAVITFSSNNTLTPYRTTLTLPTTSSPEALRGRYRVWARIKGSAASNFLVRYSQNPSVNASHGLATTVKATTSWQMVDLGSIEYPGFAIPPSIGHSGLTVELATSQIALGARRLSGTGSMHVDYIYLVPTGDGSNGGGYMTMRGGSPTWYIIDGAHNMAYGMSSGSNPFGSNGTRTVDNAGTLLPKFGPTPKLVPKENSRFYFLRTDNSLLTNTEDILMYYWPHWRTVPEA